MTVLLNPGPVRLSERVRAALARAQVCHREPEFLQLQEHVREALPALYDADTRQWAAVLIPGSGTAAVEAMLAGMVPQHGRLLVLANGVYGERMAHIAERLGITHRVQRQGWTEAVHLDAAEAALMDAAAAGEPISHVAMVHHETTSGRLNPVAAVAARCRRHGARLLLDAVSSFGAEALALDDDTLAACAATSGKCLHGVPGVALVLLARAHLPPPPRRGCYLDLHHWLHCQDRGDTPYTPAVPACHALHEALLELQQQGGWQARRQSYRARSRQVRDGLGDLGIKPLLPEADCSCVLHAFHLPTGLDYATLHDGLKQAGFIIYAGQGNLADTLFRIAVMGTIDNADLQRLLQTIRTLLPR